MHRAIYERLQEVARRRDVVYYGAIAPLANLDMAFEKDRAEIGRLLGEISTNEHEHHRPLLSAVAVYKPDDQGAESLGPGPGFFTLARELGLMGPDDDEDDFWPCELQRVHDHWGT
jgi:hypothetical protein